MRVLSFLFLASVLFTSCYKSIEEHEERVIHKILDNDTKLSLQVNTRTTTVLRNQSNYIDVSYRYKLTIDDDIEWIGGSREPVGLVFNDEKVYLSYIEDLKTTSDSIVTDTLSMLYGARLGFEEFVDETSFFGLFGKSYWAEISKKKYDAAKAKGEYFDNIGILEVNKLKAEHLDSLMVE